MTRRLFLPLVAFTVMLSGLHASVIISDDFQSYIPGSAVAGMKPIGSALTGATSGDNQILIVSDSSPIRDPFGPGNQSLAILKPVEKDPAPRVYWNFDSITSGTLTFSVYSDQLTPSRDYFRIYLYGGLSRTVGVGVGWTGPTLNVVGNGSITDGFSHNTVNHFTITFDDNKYSIMLNGSAVEIEGQTLFNFSNTLTTGVNTLEFAIASSSNSGRVYIDNVVLTTIPEASSMALLGGGLLTGALFWRRIRAQGTP